MQNIDKILNNYLKYLVSQLVSPNVDKIDLVFIEEKSLMEIQLDTLDDLLFKNLDALIQVSETDYAEILQNLLLLKYMRLAFPYDDLSKYVSSRKAPILLTIVCIQFKTLDVLYEFQLNYFGNNASITHNLWTRMKLHLEYLGDKQFGQDVVAFKRLGLEMRPQEELPEIFSDSISAPLRKLRNRQFAFSCSAASLSIVLISVTKLMVFY